MANLINEQDSSTESNNSDAHVHNNKNSEIDADSSAVLQNSKASVEFCWNSYCQVFYGL